ncbi:hypothetical protein BPOR_0758g00050 [Botrytis porri]|uniref:Uncharacterized protein n=1 Tax=Botrytis porri TaxID=87229 RepID=A0A4Z1K9K3_9HELO|nr:hypothetical protein BPOR_0758g00050 [Botrytis porri]
MVWKYRPKPKKQNQDIVYKSPETDLVAISNTVPPTKKSEFEGFPLDIINIFYDTLLERDELTAIICLALICRTCWSLFQGKPWKKYVKFGNENGCFYEPCFIKLIESWIGPGYRRIGPDSRDIETYFLSRAVYGDFPGAEEKNLKGRWQDYRALYLRDEETYHLTYLVPKPFGVSADNWFPLAARQLKNEVLSWDSWTRTRARLAASYRLSNLYRWLLANGGREWLLSNRTFQKTEICNNNSMAVLIHFPDEGQSWRMEPKRSKPTGKGTNARKLRGAGRWYSPLFILKSYGASGGY